MRTEDYFEIKRAMESYFREQNLLQEQIATELVSISKQQKALLLIFGHATEKMCENK